MLRERRQSRFRAPPELARKVSDSRRTQRPERDRSQRRSSRPLQARKRNARRWLSLPLAKPLHSPDRKSHLSLTFCLKCERRREPASTDLDGRSILHRFVDQLLQRRLDAHALAGGLLQQHEEHVLPAVDHEIAAAGAVPFQLAERARRRRLGYARFGAHAKAQPVTEAIPREIKNLVGNAGAWP